MTSGCFIFDIFIILTYFCLMKLWRFTIFYYIINIWLYKKRYQKCMSARISVNLMFVNLLSERKKRCWHQFLSVFLLPVQLIYNIIIIYLQRGESSKTAKTFNCLLSYFITLNIFINLDGNIFRHIYFLNSHQKCKFLVFKFKLFVFEVFIIILKNSIVP